MALVFHLQRFKDNDIEVKRKDGIILLRELAAEVKNFMDFKRNAVMVSDYSGAEIQAYLHPLPIPSYTRKKIPLII